MYFSSQVTEQDTPKGQPAPHQAASIFATIPNKRGLKKPLVIAGVLLVLLGLAAVGSYVLVSQSNTISTKLEPPKTQFEAQPTPQVASATFGSLLQQATNYQDWLVGVKHGSMLLLNPQTGQHKTILEADNPWYGPISQIYWSPDKTKIAALYLTDSEAKALTDNPAGYAQSLGLSSDISPQAFPFGRLTIIDVTNQRRLDTNLEVKNIAKALVWLDNNRLAVLNSSIQIYNLDSQSAQPLAMAGITSVDQQLQAPLIWQAQSQSLFFVKTKSIDNQSAQILTKLSLRSNEITEVRPILLQESTVAAYQSFDMALSPDQQKLAIIDQHGLAYIDLNNQSLTQIPYKTDLLWLKQVALSQLVWLSDYRIGFTGLSVDGQWLWGGWDIQQQQVPVFAKGYQQGAWRVSTGQLAMIDVSAVKLHIVSPNWSDPVKSHFSSVSLNWSSVYW